MAKVRAFDAHEAHFILPVRRKLTYAVGGVGEALVGDAILFALVPFYNIVLQVDAVTVGAIMFLPRFWDALTDPVMGWISDSTRSRWGRRRPYIAVGCVLLAIAIFGVFTPPRGASTDILEKYLLGFMFLYYTAMTITQTPYFSLGAELSLDYRERARVQTYRAFCTRIGAIIAGLSWAFAYRYFDTPVTGFAVVGVICAVVVIVAHWVVVLGVHEEGEVQAQPRMPLLASVVEVFRNRSFLVLSASGVLFVLGVFLALPLNTYITTYYVYRGDARAAATLVTAAQVATQVSGILFVPLVGWLSVRHGKRTAFFWGLSVFGLAPILSWFLYSPQYPYLQLVVSFLLGFGLAAWVVLPIAMIADVCDVDELRTGRRREGAYLGFFTFLFKLGLSVTAFMNGLCLDFAGFDPSLGAQSETTIRTLRIIFLSVPLVFILLAAGVLLLYPLNEGRVRDMRAQLEERRRQRLAAQ